MHATPFLNLQAVEHRRDQRLVTLLKLLLVAAALGVVGSLPALQDAGPNYVQDIVTLFAVMTACICYGAAYALTQWERFSDARRVLFATWTVYLAVQIAMVRADPSDPTLGMLHMVIANAFAALALMGVGALQPWHASRTWTIRLIVAYLVGSCLMLVAHRHDAHMLNMLSLTSGTSLLLLICAAAMARAFAQDLDESVADGETRRQREVTLRGDVERALQAAHQASAAKSQFLANMSHELRTPLSGILGFVELMEEDLQAEDLEEMRGDLGKVHRTALHLLQVVNDVLDLSKIEAGRLAVAAEQIPVVPLVEAVLQNVRALAAQKGVVVEHNATQVPDVLGDRTRVRQVLLNLLSNAVKFTRKGVVELQVRQFEDYVQFDVVDTGIGIPESALDRIFDPFEQADGSTTREYGGTGLWLAITRHLVELMGGRIQAKSVVGVGSTFAFTLPVAHGAVASQRGAVVGL